LRWLRVGTDSIVENVGCPFVGAWIEKPEGKVMAGKTPALHSAKSGEEFRTIDILVLGDCAE
jgi:hypothetical protein